jgi:hypothetical protein
VSAGETAQPQSRTPPRPQGERTKHHYVPVFYLQQWARRADGKLCEFSRPYKTPVGQPDPPITSIPVKHRWVHPDGTGFIKHLYTFPGLTPKLRNWLEDEFFRRVDNDAAQVMQRLLRGDTRFAQRDKSAWSRFLMSMFHRSPEGIQRVVRTININVMRIQEHEIRPEYERLRDEAGGGPSYEETIEQLTDADYQQFHLQTLRTIIDSRRLGAVLNNMIWTVAPRQGVYPLFTSDRPIFMTALGRDDARLVMPLTPDYLFLAAKTAPTLHVLERHILSGGFTELINNRVVRQARNFVYAFDDSRMPFLPNRLGDRQSWSPLE